MVAHAFNCSTQEKEFFEVDTSLVYSVSFMTDSIATGNPCLKIRKKKEREKKKEGEREKTKEK